MAKLSGNVLEMYGADDPDARRAATAVLGFDFPDDRATRFRQAIFKTRHLLRRPSGGPEPARAPLLAFLEDL